MNALLRKAAALAGFHLCGGSDRLVPGPAKDEASLRLAIMVKF